MVLYTSRPLAGELIALRSVVVWVGGRNPLVVDVTCKTALAPGSEELPICVAPANMFLALVPF